MLYARLIVIQMRKKHYWKNIIALHWFLKKVFKNRMEESVMKTKALFIKE